MMKTNIIQERLKIYELTSMQEEENAIKEICQEIALAGLSRELFFKKAMFKGGTCLRIMYGLRRFSEDLDFILLKPDKEFNWQPYLHAIDIEFQAFGLSLETQDRSKANENVKKAFLKETSFGTILNLQYPRTKSDLQKIRIKLEIDTNPPAGSTSETHYLDYPHPFSIVTQDIPSLFAGKCHAILCREFTKGRDWYDLTWYIQNRHAVNLELLKNALYQYGPYQNQEINVSADWLVNEIKLKAESMDWQAVINDVVKFLPHHATREVAHWNSDLFKAMLKKLKENMS